MDYIYLETDTDYNDAKYHDWYKQRITQRFIQNHGALARGLVLDFQGGVINPRYFSTVLRCRARIDWDCFEPMEASEWILRGFDDEKVLTDIFEDLFFETVDEFTRANDQNN